MRHYIILLIFCVVVTGCSHCADPTKRNITDHDFRLIGMAREVLTQQGYDPKELLYEMYRWKGLWVVQVDRAAFSESGELQGIFPDSSLAVYFNSKDQPTKLSSGGGTIDLLKAPTTQRIGSASADEIFLRQLQFAFPTTDAAAFPGANSNYWHIKRPSEDLIDDRGSP